MKSLWLFILSADPDPNKMSRIHNTRTHTNKISSCSPEQCCECRLMNPDQNPDFLLPRLLLYDGRPRSIWVKPSALPRELFKAWRFFRFGACRERRTISSKASLIQWQNTLLHTGGISLIHGWYLNKRWVRAAQGRVARPNPTTVVVKDSDNVQDPKIFCTDQDPLIRNPELRIRMAN